MKFARSYLSVLSVVLTVLLFTACGGGGDDSSVVTDTTTGVSITPTNAKAISAKAVSSVDTVEGSTTAADFVTGVSISLPDSGFTYPELVLRQLERLPTLASQSDTGSVTGAVTSETFDCTDGGTVTLTADVVDPNALTVGDTITVSYNNCTESGVVLNGAMSITMTEVTGTLDGIPPYALGFKVIFTSLSMSDGSLVVTTDGDMSMRLSDDGTGNESLLLSGNAFTTSTADVVESMTNYRYDFEVNSISGAYSLDMQGTINSTEIGGSVSFVTLETFTGNDFGVTDNPTAGVLLITGIDNSQARVTAQPDGTNVQIEVDADGDGMFETIIMTTWTELESL
ncbi:MAG: hypothetical protein ABFR65_01435 [Pseudomonadota bacterium]